MVGLVLFYQALAERHDERGRPGHRRGVGDRARRRRAGPRASGPAGSPWPASSSPCRRSCCSAGGWSRRREPVATSTGGAFVLAAAAGVGFGLFFVTLSRASSDAGTLAGARRPRCAPSPRWRSLVTLQRAWGGVRPAVSSLSAGAGVLDTTANAPLPARRPAGAPVGGGRALLAVPGVDHRAGQHACSTSGWPGCSGGVSPSPAWRWWPSPLDGSRAHPHEERGDAPTPAAGLLIDEGPRTRWR